MKHYLSGIAAFLCSSMVVATAQAALLVDVGHHNLQPNMAGQQVHIFVSADNGSTNVAGLDLAVQVGDGTSGPRITGVNLEDGTIFESNNDGQAEAAGNTDWIKFFGILTNSGTVPVPTESTLLATLTIDTTGLGEGGVYDLRASDILDNAAWRTMLYDAQVNEVNATFQNGSLTIIPEPASLALLSAAGLVLLGRRRQKRQSVAV